MTRFWRYFFGIMGRNAYYPRSIVLVDVYVTGAALLTMKYIMELVIKKEQEEGALTRRTVKMLALNLVRNPTLREELREYADFLGGPDADEPLKVVPIDSVDERNHYIRWCERT